MGQTAGVMSALNRCFDAVLDSTLWPEALQNLGEQLGAQSCTFASGNANRDPLVFPRSSGHEGFAALWMANQEHAPDPHVPRAGALIRRGRRVLLEHDIATESERASLDYYGATAARGRREWWAAIGVSTATSRYCMPLYRSAERGAFQPAELQAALKVRPHLSELLALAETVTAALDKERLGTLETLRIGAISVSVDGRISQMNASAEALLGRSIRVNGRRLGAMLPDDEERLQQLVRHASGATQAAPPAQLWLRAENTVLIAEAFPLSRLGRAYFGGGCGLITFKPAPTAHRPDPRLRERFGLTGAEARLVAMMLDGADNATLAQRLGVAVDTVKTHLKSIYQKTGATSRARVIALALGSSQGRPDGT